MKSYKIVLFIFGVIAMLGLLCAFFPAEGVKVGPAQLKFLSLRDALGGEPVEEEPAEPVESPEEILARILADVRSKEEAEFVAFNTTDPIRLSFPDGDVSYLDPLFEAFDSAMIYPVRIVHYGDSQLEEDRITHVYRDVLQEKFGGNGVGMCSAMQTAMTLTTRQKRSRSLPRTMVFGNEREFSVSGGRYGMMGMASRLSGGTFTVSFYPSTNLKTDGPSKYFHTVTVITDTMKAPISVSYGDVEAVMDTIPSALRRYRLSVPDSTSSASIKMTGSADIYGILLDGETGVSVDNVAMRGCSGTVFTKINADQLKDFYQGNNVRLIILQYGGNSVPYMRTGKPAAQYGETIAKQIQYVHAAAPDAMIIFIGPSDMSTNIGGSMQTYSCIPGFVDTLRNVANRNGAAYWDLYGVMGGKNSMAKWVRSGLAGPDYVHFTHKGADKVGGLFGDMLLKYYDYYKWRTKPEGEQLDSLVLDSLLKAQCAQDTL